MDIKDFQRLLNLHKTELSRYLTRNLPVKAGARAKSIIQENFRLGGFQDGALSKWQITKRQLSGKDDADSKRSPLLSSRKVLYNGTGYKPGNGNVTIFNNVLYAGIHNAGGVTHPRVTQKMRKYAWARYYEASGREKDKEPSESSEAQIWKGLALTKKKVLNIKIPKRQFIGPSKTIDTVIQTMIENDLNNIIKL
jgi:phage gpG-like protein